MPPPQPPKRPDSGAPKESSAAYQPQPNVHAPPPIQPQPQSQAAELPPAAPASNGGQQPVSVEAKPAVKPGMPGAPNIPNIPNIPGAEDGKVEAPPSTQKTLPLGQRLLKKGLISEDQLETALKEQQRDGTNKKKLLGTVLVEMGFISESALGEVLTESSGVKQFDLKKAVLDPNLIKQIPKEVAIRCKAVPVSVDRDTVHVAITDIYNILAIDQIRKHFPSNLKIVPVYGTESEILEIIDQYYGYEMTIDGILKEIETGVSDNQELSGEIEGYVNPTVRLVDSILVDAIKRGASDIHFEPEGSFLRLRYRIDGKMLQVRSFHKDYWAAIVVRIKIMAGMNIAETRNPQDGRTSYYVSGREVDFRVATHPTVHGENIVMRILDKEKALVPIEKLGFSEKNDQILKKLLKRPEGIIIVTGPTGSGKTTTLYSIINFINSVDINIMTLENPVEYQLPMIRQSDVKEEYGMDFVSGIKSLMRQDPDVIFVGEVRDEATANMAMRAAMTGHRVFTTLHTNDAMGAIPRLIDIGIPPHLLAGSLICTIAQRLIRKLCTHCRKEKTASEDDCRILGVDSAKPPTIYEHKGCLKCGGFGYKGRISVNEILPVDKGLDELIASGAMRKTMLEYAMEKGFVPMVQDGTNKVLAGVTDIAELIRTVDVTDRL